MDSLGLGRVDVRDAVLDAALKEFAARGYGATSVQGILDVVGTSERLFRAHFCDKADLALAVLERETARHAKVDMRIIATNRDEFWAELRSRTAVPDEHCLAAADLARLVVSAHRHPEFVARMGPFSCKWREKLAMLLSHGQELHAVRSDLPMGVLLNLAQGLKQAAVDTLLPGQRLPSDTELGHFSEQYVSILQRSLGCR